MHILKSEKLDIVRKEAKVGIETKTIILVKHDPHKTTYNAS